MNEFIFCSWLQCSACNTCCPSAFVLPCKLKFAKVLPPPLKKNLEMPLHNCIFANLCIYKISKLFLHDLFVFFPRIMRNFLQFGSLAYDKKYIKKLTEINSELFSDNAKIFLEHYKIWNLFLGGITELWSYFSMPSEINSQFCTEMRNRRTKFWFELFYFLSIK